MLSDLGESYQQGALLLIIWAKKEAAFLVRPLESFRMESKILVQIVKPLVDAVLMVDNGFFIVILGIFPSFDEIDGIAEGFGYLQAWCEKIRVISF